MLGTSPSNSEGAASVSGQGARIPHACGQKPRGKFNKGFKKWARLKKKSAKIKKKKQGAFLPFLFSLPLLPSPTHTGTNWEGGCLGYIER